MKKLFSYAVAATVPHPQTGARVTVSLAGAIEAGNVERVKGIAFDRVKAEAPAASVDSIAVVEIPPAMIAAFIQKNGGNAPEPSTPSPNILAVKLPKEPTPGCDCPACTLAKLQGGIKFN